METSANARYFVETLHDFLDQEVTIGGWITTKRDHGKVLFLDLCDSTGTIQAVATANQDFFTTAQSIKEQSAVRASGTIVMRPEKLKTDEPNGDIELQITALTVINRAPDLPWGTQSSDEVNEELRMRYRYLDLRNERLHHNLKTRSSVYHFLRNYLHTKGFTEIETPYITKGTPEGAREYLVPSRLHTGKFYALPQSPQQFKQLLMVAGFDRYFQIARCFRDEDTRGDRQPEFTQLDVEMSFATTESILDFVETMYTTLITTLFPEKRLTFRPFQRLTYAQSMEKYGTDKPDLRHDKNDPHELAFVWITDQPMFEQSETANKLVAVHHLFTRPKEGDEPLLDTDPIKARAASYDLALNGYEIVGGSLRIHEPELQKKVFAILSLSDDEVTARFRHMLEAFSYGAPPHGGFASGLDRLLAVLCGEPNIREVIAFPKTGDGRDLMMEAPSEATPEQLRELHIRILNETTDK